MLESFFTSPSVILRDEDTKDDDDDDDNGVEVEIEVEEGKGVIGESSTVIWTSLKERSSWDTIVVSSVPDFTVKSFLVLLMLEDEDIFETILRFPSMSSTRFIRKDSDNEDDDELASSSPIASSSSSSSSYSSV